MIAAHKKIKNKRVLFEPLSDHENLTVEYAEKISSREIVEKLGYSYEEFLKAIRYHDRGKCSINFQKSRMHGETVENGTTDHSVLSALLYLEGNLSKQSILNAYVILNHHSDLDNLLKYNLRLENFKEFEKLISSKITLRKDIFEKALNKIIKIFTLKDYWYIRYLYSILCSSDIFATQEFMQDYKFEKCSSFQEIKEMIYHDPIIRKIAAGDLGKDINRLRSEMALEAVSNLKPGLSLLEAPTGAGKTKTGYLLAEKLPGEKLFYIAPFNAISTQTYKDLLEIFPAEHVGLINSASEINYEDTSAIDAYNDYYQLNSPIVVTSSVKFFDILYSTRKKDLLMFYTLAGSTIIVDEIQAFSIGVWKNFSRDISLISEIFNINFIIMSATLPNLDVFHKNFNKLIRNRDYYFKSRYFKERVSIEKINISSLQELEIEIIAAFEKREKILVEFISRKMAKEFYELISQKCSDSYIITSDTRNAEREALIAATKDPSWKGILIGTQVLEAGINIDFDIGFKNISILESEEQFAGRINRNCLKENCRVFLFDLYDAKNILKNDVRVSDRMTVKNDMIFEILKEKEFDKYYEEILSFLDRKSEFKEYYNFKKKYDSMELIAKDTETIFILSDESRKIFDEYVEIFSQKNLDFYEKSIKIKNTKAKILEFSINLYENVIEKNKDKLKEIHGLKYMESVDL